MYFDSQMVLAGSISASGVITGALMNGAGAILGTNTLDIGPCNFGGNQVTDMGTGEQINVNVSVLTAPTAGTSVQFQLVQADTADLATNLQVICQTDAYPIAALPAGAIIPMSFDPTAPYIPKRYIGLRVVNVGAIATLSVFAAVTPNQQTMKTVFKGGYGIS